MYKRQVTQTYDDIYGGAIYSGTVLVSAPNVITADFAIREGTTAIDAYAFYGCTFEDGVTLTIPESVTEIGEYAFRNTNLAAVNLPTTLKVIGAYAFNGTSLTTVSIPSGVTSIGANAFANARNLTEVNFGNRTASLSLGAGVFSGCTAIESITLPNLVESNGAVVLADNTFNNCTSLKEINLANVTAIGNSAFKGCTALVSVDLKNVTVIGDGAFNGCTALTSVTGLAKVTDIGNNAFYTASLTAIDLSSAVNIGNLAFFGNAETSVKIPASLVKLGNGAFAGSEKLTSFEVDANNKTYFVESGVLYRLISGTTADGEYELCSYPSAKRADMVERVRVFNVKDGTVSVQAYAFARLNENVIGEVVLPYSVKVIGDAAFYKSGINSYVFNSINAPVLLTTYYDVSALTNYKTEYYLNFEDGLIEHTATGIKSTLKISYPANGLGYDNYVYSNYFGTVVSLGELMDDTTRTLKKLIEGFESVETVASWANLDKTDENYEMVNAFSENVKSAHATYNTITAEKQLEYLGADNVKKLFDIESALKAVKQHFNIQVSITSLRVSADSAHKTEYKVGEKFDMTGLKIIVIYDDYSSEEADISQVKLAAGYDGELAVTNRYVRVQYLGKTLQIGITVTEDGGETPEVPPETPASGCSCSGTTTFGDGGTGGYIALGLVMCALAVTVIVRSKKKKS